MPTKTEKIPELHYEQYITYMRKLLGLNPVATLNQAMQKSGKEWGSVGEFEVDAFFRAAIPNFSELSKQMHPKAQNTVRTLRTSLFHACQFDRHKRVFRIEEGLTQRLLHTSVERVDSSFVKSPFQSIYISLPYNKELFIPDEDKAEYPVEGMYIWFQPDMDTDSIHTDYEGKNSVKDLLGGASTCNILKILAIGKDGACEFDPALFYATFMLTPGDVFPQLAKAVERFSTTEHNKPYVESVFRFALNVLLYITAPDAELGDILAKFEKAGGDPKVAERKNKGLSKINQVSVGSSISIMRGLERMYSDRKSLSRNSVSCPKWLVRGHWRNQAHGEGRLLRKMAWIQPYEKGW